MDSSSLPVLRVGQAITICNTLLGELEFAIEGEVASFSISRGKFVFFDLKDELEEARLACFMMAYQMPFPLEVGMRIVVRGTAGLYQKSGQFRISVTTIEAKGEGSLKRAYELLRLKLQEEGLFSTERKRLLPRFAGKVGIISSADAAGFGDFRTIAFQRLPGVQYILINVAVQGKDSEKEICQAFDYLNTAYSLDAIVLVRGGGSIEDLHAFNSEPVARAIVRSKAPVVVGVGHERDITIADFCADVRAATPSNAAQLLLPTKEEVSALVSRLTQEGQRRVEKAVQGRRDKVQFTLSRLKQQLQYSVQSKKLKVENIARTVEALSPEATLRRGYSITSTGDGKLLTPERAKTGTPISTRLAQGIVQSIIT